MIRLNPAVLRLAAPPGEVLFNLDELQRDLWQCCREVGLHESELPADVVAVLAQYAESRRGDARPLAPEDLERTVVRMLLDVGLAELAASLKQRRGANDEPPEDALPVEAGAVRQILAADPFFLAKPLDLLCQQTAEKLLTLGLRRVRPTLVRELARDLWEQLHGQPAGDAGERYWLIHRRDMPGVLGPDAALMSAGIVDAPSISELLPAISLRVDLPALARAAVGPGETLTELALFPALDAVGARLLEIVERLRAEVRRRLRVGDDEDVHAAIVLVGSQTLAHDLLGLTRPGQNRLRQELANAVAACFAHDARIRTEIR